MSVVNLVEKFSLVTNYWSPKIIGELNGQVVKIAKIKGEFIWHKHENEDEFFFVVKGQMTVKMRDQDVVLKQGEFTIVPKGVEHKPVAEQETFILMFEPLGTLNTGNIQDAHTIEEIERI
ncbi:MAG: cupin domain-containing protein [Chloroflexota bacterium]|nr:cupin domain-containing protein [Chloroflexota bacterium]